jgi:hypothetical protein
MIIPNGEIQIHQEIAWHSLKTYLQSLYRDDYDFRGQKNGSQPLKSCLERNFPLFTKEDKKYYYINACNHMASIGLFKELNINDPGTIITEFFNNEETTHNSTNITPKPHHEKVKIFNLYLEKYISLYPKWHSIMSILQHHNVPTDFLDITKSFYIAAYFALFNSVENCSENEKEYPAILAIKKIPDRNNLIERMFRSKPKIDFNSKFIHERQWAQQSGFIDSSLDIKYEIHKCIIDPKWIKDIYEDLKLMNINGYSLFKTKEMAGIDYFNQAKYQN